MLRFSILSVAAAVVPKSFYDASGKPFLPFGFYQYTISGPDDQYLPRTEAPHGMSLTSPYVSTAAPDQQWWDAMDSFLDDAHAAGSKVHFQLMAFANLDNDDATLANLTAQIEHFKGHPAILAWYLADEPGGQGIPPEKFVPKYAAIKAADTDHPVSMVFCCVSADSYLDVLDLIMVDPYPIPNSDASSVYDSVGQVASLGKPIMMVPQAFGGGENWARGPSAQEERVMTYLGLIQGAIGIQYFVRKAEAGFPYAASAWSEIRKIAVEVKELQSALLLGARTPIAASSSVPGCSAAGASWEDRDKSIVVLVATLANAEGPPCPFHIALPTGTQTPAAVDVFDIFENRAIARNVTSAGFDDALRGFATAAYRVVPSSKASAPAVSSELVYNPSYEINMNAAVPDGNYVGVPGDKAGTFFSDSRLSVDGRHSLHLHAPSAGNGVSMSPYTVPRVAAGATYIFSVWARGAQGGETVDFSFTPSIFTLQAASNVLQVTATAEWTQHTVTMVATGDPKGACPYGCRSWLAYVLSSAGDVWLDVLSLQATAVAV